MTTVVKEPGSVRIEANTKLCMYPGGSVFFCMAVQDYVPPSNAALVAWIDFGDTGTTTTRDANVQIPGRSGDPGGAAWSIDGGSAYAVSRQNDRPVAHFGAASLGMTGTWGPLAATGSWTMMMFLKVDRPVNDFGTLYTGLGRPMVLLSCPAVGLVVELPTQGTVPVAAVYDGTNTAPIDAAAGTPWDAVFVDHWRQLCITNDAASGVRTTYVDGWPVATGPASAFAVPADTAVTIGAGCPMAFAEWLVWDGVPMTPADIDQTCRAQRVKWNVTLLPPGTATSSSAQAALLALPAALTVVPEPPAPVLWLDSTRGVCRDAEGTKLAPAYGRVRRWTDSGAGGNHCAFTVQCKAAYGIGPLDRIHNKLPVVQVDAGPGVFRYNPLNGTDATGFTVLAVWRTVADADGGGGHPLSGANPVSLFGESMWTEWIGPGAPVPVRTAPPAREPTRRASYPVPWRCRREP
jgi:hypothetical protein